MSYAFKTNRETEIDTQLIFADVLSAENRIALKYRQQHEIIFIFILQTNY